MHQGGPLHVDNALRRNYEMTCYAINDSVGFFAVNGSSQHTDCGGSAGSGNRLTDASGEASHSLSALWGAAIGDGVLLLNEAEHRWFHER